MYVGISRTKIAVEKKPIAYHDKILSRHLEGMRVFNDDTCSFHCRYDFLPIFLIRQYRTKSCHRILSMVEICRLSSN